MPRFTYALSLCTRVFSCVLAMYCAGAIAQQQQSQPFSGGGHLTYIITYSSGQCGPYGSYSYQETSFTNLIYVDWNGNQNALGGGGAYFNSPGGSSCPPNGPQPSSGLTYTGTTSAASYSITVMPGASAESANISYPYCSVTSEFIPNTVPNGYGPSNAHYQVDGSTSCPGATLFYTTDGSQPTEASNYCGSQCDIYTGGPDGVEVQIIAVQMQPSGSMPGVTVQNGQASAGDSKTVLASTQAQSQPYAQYYNSPALDYCATQYCNDGVQGIPAAVNFVSDGSLNVPSASSRGGWTAANLKFTTENLQGTWNGSGPSSPSAPNGTQVLWPYNTGTTGCDTCTSMVQDFYIWPQNTSSISAANTQNWEVDLQGWDTTHDYWLGASLQCSGADGGWEYNGQVQPGWTLLKDANGHTINHDCPLPYGTLGANMGSTDTQFTLTPAKSNSTVEPGMIVMVDSEEILCTAVNGNICTSAMRGYGDTTAAPHSGGAPWSGSVQVQYHVTVDTANSNTVYIDYLNLNYNPVLNGNSALNHYDFRQIYGTKTLSDGTVVSLLSVPGSSLPSTYPDRVFDQKQIDVAPGVGSTSNPVTQGEFVDQDNVTAGYGIMGSVTLVGQP